MTVRKFLARFKHVLASIAGFLIWLVIKAVIGPRGVTFVGDHLFLACFLPLLIAFLILLGYQGYQQYKQ